jgi:tetratricopeptide (TPR) repeat protein
MKLFAVALSVLFVAYGQGKDDMETSYQNLQKAVADKDVAQVKKLAAETSAAARAIIKSPEPQAAAEKETWTTQVAFAKEVDDYTESALYSVGIQVKPEETVDLFAQLEQQNPKSKYLDEGYAFYVACLQRTAGSAKAAAAASKGLANFPGNDGLLAVLAEAAMAGQRYDQAISYGDRLVAAAGKHGKNAEVGEGNYIAGVGHFFKNQYPPADKSLRAALPYLSGDQKGCALLYLGMANFNLGKATMNKGLMQQGAGYSEQSAALKSPCQADARRQAMAMKVAAK